MTDDGFDHSQPYYQVWVIRTTGEQPQMHSRMNSLDAANNLLVRLLTEWGFAWGEVREERCDGTTI